MHGLIALTLAFAVLLPAAGVAAQDEREDRRRGTTLAEVPTTGVARLGPISPVEGAPVAEAEPEDEAPKGVAPVQIQIDAAAVDAPVEEGQILDGVMQDPSGPWVVTWYKDLWSLGEGGNVVMAGHVDYWDTGPAVFYSIGALTEGDVIRVIGEDGETYEYAVEWSKLYNVATELTPEVIRSEVVGTTDGEETLTLITCGGEFNYDTGEYVSRMVLRATKL
jgi:sortase (surface protein transpeptidase)